MIIYRLTTGEFAKDLSGEGSRLYGGRWNFVGNAALYTSEYISLCILEILVRTNKDTSPDRYALTSLKLPEDSVSKIQLKNLKENWQVHPEYTQYIGDEFLKNNQALALKVPSAIVTQEHNFLINPLHTDFKKVEIIKSELLNLDKRLLL
ncbi:MAG TPA: RES family NAD+ phosphorylase [Chitinophagaceae bacterium]|nr:RES family NAD+ phosphorylase [Chitinophagaceae bacterium]